MEPTVINCGAACTVTHVITLGGSADLTPDKVQAYMELWGLFIVAAVAVLCAKAIYRRFKLDYDH